MSGMRGCGGGSCRYHSAEGAKPAHEGGMRMSRLAAGALVEDGAGQGGKQPAVQVEPWTQPENPAQEGTASRQKSLLHFYCCF